VNVTSEKRAGKGGFSLVVIIPAFNEALRIASVINGIREVVPKAAIVVIDDGSSDDTAEVAATAGARVLPHPFNLGYGAALQTGYRYALEGQFDLLVQMDGDGQHDPASIAALLEPLRSGSADIVIGSRFLNQDAAVPQYRAPLARRIGMLLFGTIASVITGRKVTDPTSGFQAMRRRVFSVLAGDSFPVDYPDADVIIMLHRAGFVTTEVAVRMFERPEKSMHSGFLKPMYYIFKMFLSIAVTLMRK
jgi:glycosyltransferase involved in cell wall biosynthesis